jgi:hypothetical protein
MEFWPKKIDWSVYEEELSKGEFCPSACLLNFSCDDPPDAGSWNAALSDYFPLLLPNLPASVCDAIGPFIGAIATCGIDGWPQSNDGPDWLYDNSRDLYDIAIGQVYSPTTVTKIVEKFESVPLQVVRVALADAWSCKSNDPADYRFSSNEHFEDSEDFLEYLLAWYATFREAAAEGYGVGIGWS